MDSDSRERRKRSARFNEIALEAGVSMSTVDRVLNERGSVSGAARERVLAAARRLNVPRILPDARHGVVHFDILMTSHAAPFVARLDAAIERAIQTLDRRIQVHRITVPSRDERAVTRAIVERPYKRTGLIAVCTDKQPMREALRSVIASGEPVALMVSDLPDLPPHHYAGIDHYKAGRTAGYWIGRLAKRKGRVLILNGMDGVLAHHERARGCIDALSDYFPTLDVVVSPEHCDDADRSYRYTSAEFKKGGLVGIYDTGYGSTGVMAALHRFGAQGSTVWIGNEMLDLHRQYLKERAMDMVIDQNPDGQVASALQHLLHASGQIDFTPYPELREFRVFTMPNVRETNYMD